MHSHARAVPWLAIALAALGIPSSFATQLPPLVQVNPLRNGSFENSVTETHSEYPTPVDTPVYGVYWNNAEGKIVATQSSQHLALELTNEGDRVTQRFAGYEYTAQGAANVQGGTLSTVITGKLYTNNVNIVADVVLEETDAHTNAGLWDFSLHPPGGTAGEFRYWYKDTTTGVIADMTAYPYGGDPDLAFLGHWAASSANSLTWIKFESQAAAKNKVAMRAWKAPADGRVLVESRVCWDRDMLPHPNQWSLYSVYAGVIVYASETNRTAIAVPVPAKPVLPGDGFTISTYVDVAAGNLIAFEVEEAQNTSGSIAVRFDPTISYEPRHVTYRFSASPPSPPPGPCPPINKTIVRANAWQSFTLNAGADFSACFSPIDGFTHGPVPQLTLRLELVSDDSHTDFVRFDDLAVSTGLLGLSAQELEDEIRDETDRIVNNHMTYELVDQQSSTVEPHSRYTFDILTGAQTSVQQYGKRGSLSDLALSASAQYHHPVSTPWMLGEADAIIQHRDPTWGIAWVYKFATAAYVEPKANLGLVVNTAGDINYLLRVYDLTHDFHALEMAYRNAEVILDYGLYTSTPTTALYETRFWYHPGATPAFEQWPDAPPLEEDLASRPSALQSLAAVYARALPYVHTHFPRCNEMIEAARLVAYWIHDFYDLQGYGAYWMNIDNEFDDVFGYSSNACSAALLDVSEPIFEDVLAQGVDDLQPEWVQTTARGTRMAGDQQRGWNAWMYFFDQDPVIEAALGQAYVDAARYYVATGQLGNGVWSAVNASHFQRPDLSGSGGTPLTACDGAKFAPLAKAYSNAALASQSIVSPALKTELRAYFASMYRMNRLHYGGYLAYINNQTMQLGYGEDPFYPEAPSGTPSTKPGTEFRALGSALDMLKALEGDLGIDRPVASITPDNFGYSASGPVSSQQQFMFSDADGIGTINTAEVTVTKFLGNVQVAPTDYYTVNGTNFTLAIGPTSKIATWKPSAAPTLASGYTYRFTLKVVDNTERWHMDTVYYEIP